MKKGLSGIISKIPDRYDWLVMAGLGSIGYGLFLISLPLALIVTGSILLLIGVYGAWLKARTGGKHGG